ncbi:transcription initiation factor TFIID subunit 9-like [Triticum dicoccoides]|uniref:transcription initiation factor TFIID subunit 9-like n=1 Tax=Triticum dicoccoides TaxID=85692 RepID=UPI0018903B11|nr:transcription initiation factor TFIID subunit 9-like [Triticum dicoccoides]
MDSGVGRTPPPAAAADAGDEPRDARVVKEILRSVGLEEGDYEPAVVHQFMRLAHRYTGDVLGDALVYADHAGRASLQADDVHLAIRSNATFGHELPGREVFLEMAHSLNKNPIPKPPPGSIRLPHDQDMMLGQKYLCIPQMKPSIDNVEGTKNDNTVGVEEDVEPDEAVPINDDEDEMMFPELVDVAS